MNTTLKRIRRTKVAASDLRKKILDLITLGHKIPDIAKDFNLQRQLVQYYARKSKQNTFPQVLVANKTEVS